MLARIKQQVPRRSRSNKASASIKRRSVISERPTISAPRNFQHTTHVPSPLLTELAEEGSAATSTPAPTPKITKRPATLPKPSVAAKPAAQAAAAYEECQLQEKSGDIVFEGSVWAQDDKWQDKQEWKKMWAVVERINSTILALLIYSDCNRGSLKLEHEMDKDVPVRKCPPTYGKLHVVAVSPPDESECFLAFDDETSMNMWLASIADVVGSGRLSVEPAQEPEPEPVHDKPPPIPPRRKSSYANGELSLPTPAALAAEPAAADADAAPAVRTPMKTMLSDASALAESLDEARKKREAEEDEFEALCNSPGGVFGALGFGEGAAAEAVDAGCDTNDEAAAAAPEATEEPGCKTAPAAAPEAPNDGASAAEELAEVPRSPMLEVQKRLRSPSKRKPSRFSAYGNRPLSVATKSPLAAIQSAVAEELAPVPNTIQLTDTDAGESTVDSEAAATRPTAAPPPIPPTRKSQVKLQLQAPLAQLSDSTDTDADEEEDWCSTASFSPMFSAATSVSTTATVEEELQAMRQAFEAERAALLAEREKSANLEKQVKRLKMQLQKRGGKSRQSMAAKRMSILPAYPPPPPPRNSMASF